MKCVRKQISEAEVCDGDMLCEATRLEGRSENEDLYRIGPFKHTQHNPCSQINFYIFYLVYLVLCQFLVFHSVV